MKERALESGGDGTTTAEKCESWNGHASPGSGMGIAFYELRAYVRSTRLRCIGPVGRRGGAKHGMDGAR